MERIPEIDGLRALAALSVFVHHVFEYPALVRVTGAGWIGVDLFFVISGYLITTILLGLRGSPHYFRNFYIRRTLRIFPPYYALFVLGLIYAVFDRSYHFSGRLWTAYALYATSLVVVRPWYFGAESHLPGPARAIEVTWSLSIEELFYILWAPAVRFLKNRQLEVLVFSIILLAPVIRWYVHSAGHRTEYFFFPARMDTLALGALLALVRDRFPISLPGWPVIVGLVSSASLLFLIADPESNAWFAIFGYSVIALSMALVLAFVLDRSAGNHPVCRVLRSRLLVRLGTISYMFYLLHLFVIKSFREVFANLLVSHWVLNRILQVTGSLAVTVLLAALSWKYFESPILRLKDRFGTGPREPAAIGATVDHIEPAVFERLA
jgi:peptidoglycan/LPS O-acetylase OafA/YrhL